MSWDTASSERDLASYSVCIVLQIRGEMIFVLDVVRERLEYPHLQRKLIELHGRWRTVGNNYSLLIEGMSLIQDLRHKGIHAISIVPEGHKTMRMNAQTARIEARSVSCRRARKRFAKSAQAVMRWAATGVVRHS